MTPTTEPHDPPHSPTPSGRVVDLAQEEAWFAELKRLREERPYPPTFDADRLADMNWFFEEWNAGRLDGYMRRYVAIRNKTVVGEDMDPTRLEVSLARRHPDVNPDCFFITYVD